MAAVVPSIWLTLFLFARAALTLPYVARPQARQKLFHGEEAALHPEF